MSADMRPDKPGFYWLKIDGEWQPARWDGEAWWTLRMQGLVHECQELGPRILTPGDVQNLENALVAANERANRAVSDRAEQIKALFDEIKDLREQLDEKKAARR